MYIVSNEQDTSPHNPLARAVCEGFIGCTPALFTEGELVSVHGRLLVGRIMCWSVRKWLSKAVPREPQAVKVAAGPVSMLRPPRGARLESTQRIQRLA